MLRIAFLALIHRKKNSSFYFALLLLVFVLILTVLPLFNGIMGSSADAGAAKYGKHDIALYNLTKEQIAELKKNIISKVGVVETYGSWGLAGSGRQGTITLGNFDDTAWKLSCIRVLSGNLPQAENEIALEQNTRFRLGVDFAVGDSLTLTQEGINKTFIISGIISNYTNYWDVPQTTTLVAGYNDMPKALVFPQNDTPIKNLHVLGYTDGYGREMLQNALDWQVDFSASGLYYFGVLENQLAPLNTFRNIFFVIIVFGVILCVSIGLSLYIDSYRSTYQTLYALGADGVYPFYLFATQQLIFLLSAAVCSVPLAYLVTLLAKTLLGNNIAVTIFTPSNFLLLAITIVLLCVLALYKFRRSVYTIQGKSLSQNKKQKAKQMQISGSFSWALSLSFMGTTLKKVLPILLLVGILFSTVSFTNVYFQDFLYSNAFNALEKEYVDQRHYNFKLNAAGAHATATFETVELCLDKNRVFPSQIIDELYRYNGVEFVRIYMYGLNAATLLLPATQDSYWLNFDHTWQDDAEIGYPSSAITGVPQDVISAGYTLYVLDEALIPALKETYPEMTAAIDNLGKDEVLAMLPPIESGAQNKTIFPGYTLRFGELTYEHTNFKTVWDNPKLITYVEHSLTVASVYEQKFEVSIHGRTEKTGSPTFFITKETFYTNDLFKGIEDFNIYLSPDISERDYAAVEQYVMELGASLDNVNVYSRREEAKQDQQFMDVISTALAIMLVVLGLFIVICLFTTLYMTLLQRKHSISIMRGLGMPRRTLARAIFTELCMYMLYCFFISIIVYFLMMYLVFAEIFSTSVTIANTLSMLGALGICIGAMLIICGFIVHFLLNDIYKESINTALRAVD